MALSPETEAIIKRLKAEGDLIRNTGTNSIKSVNVNLAKFQDVFQSMNENIQALGAVSNGEKIEEILEHQQDLSYLNAEQRKEYEEDAAKRALLQNDIANRQLKLQEKELEDREKDRLEREKSDKRIFGKGGLLSKALGGAFDFIKKAFFIGVAGTLIYEFAAGFLEKQYGIELPTVADGLKSFSTFLKEVNWENLGEQLKILASTDFGAVLTAITVGGVATSVGSKVLDAVTTLSLAKILEKMMTSTANDVAEAVGAPTAADVAAAGSKPGAKTRGLGMLRFIRGSIPGILFGGLVATMPAIENLFRERALGMTEAEISEAQVNPADAVNIGGNAVSSIAAFLLAGGGPPGWAAALGFFALKTVYDILEAEKRKIGDEAANAALSRVDETTKQISASERLLEQYEKELARRIEEGEPTDDIRNLIALAKANSERLEEQRREEEFNARRQIYEDLDAARQALAKLEGKAPTISDIDPFKQKRISGGISPVDITVEKSPEEIMEEFERVQTAYRRQMQRARIALDKLERAARDAVEKGVGTEAQLGVGGSQPLVQNIRELNDSTKDAISTQKTELTPAIENLKDAILGEPRFRFTEDDISRLEYWLGAPITYNNNNISTVNPITNVVGGQTSNSSMVAFSQVSGDVAGNSFSGSMSA